MRNNSNRALRKTKPLSESALDTKNSSIPAALPRRARCVRLQGTHRPDATNKSVNCVATLAATQAVSVRSGIWRTHAMDALTVNGLWRHISNRVLLLPRVKHCNIAATGEC